MIEWSTACPDWERRIVARESLIPFQPLFPAEAEAALNVFNDLRIVDAANSPTTEEACRPWVFDFVNAVFGSYDHSTGRRLIREYLLLVSKKNSKSTIAAGVMLTALVRNWRRSAEFLILAPTIEVARNSFDPAYDMIMASPELKELLDPKPTTRTIVHRTTKATLRVVAADNEAVAGKKATGVLVDELWLFGKRAGAENMLREATGGLASRPEGFVIYLSTQSDEVPAGVFKQRLDYFRDVRDGKRHDPRSLPVIYEFPEPMLKSEAYKRPENFYVTNPNLGASVDEEDLLSEFSKAELGDQSSINGFYAKRLNVEIGMGMRANRWPGAEFWIRRAKPHGALTLEGLIEQSEAITVGLDGGGLDDLYGFHALGRERREHAEADVLKQRWLAWGHSWCHKGVLDRRKSIAGKLGDFAKARELTIVDDDLGDIEGILALIGQIKDAGLLAKVAVDPAGLGEMIAALESIQITQENGLLVGVSQGFGLMNAIKTTERKLARGTLVHSGSALMAWAVSNLKIEPTATAIRATKQNAGDAKIDPVMALFDAVVPMSLNPEPVRAADPSEFLREPLFA